jgi:hypothetical protein
LNEEKAITLNEASLVDDAKVDEFKRNALITSFCIHFGHAYRLFTACSADKCCGCGLQLASFVSPEDWKSFANTNELKSLISRFALHAKHADEHQKIGGALRVRIEQKLCFCSYGSLPTLLCIGPKKELAISRHCCCLRFGVAIVYETHFQLYCQSSSFQQAFCLSCPHLTHYTLLGD